MPNMLSSFYPSWVTAPDGLYCGIWKKCLPRVTLTDLTMPNIELDRVIFIYHNVFQYHVP